MGIQETPPKTSECSHCESFGEIGYASFQRQQNENRTKVFVRNLPPGISESGVRNLFLSVGEPVLIRFLKASGTAVVEFSGVNEVELAIRDLDGKPPYNLKVALFRPRCELPRQNTTSEEKQDLFSKVIRLKANSVGDSQEEGSKDGSKSGSQVEKLLRDVIKKIGYDPSLRIRQKKLDFKTDLKCVSKGRGFLNMGDKDRFIGGLQKFELSSEYDKAKDEMNFSCAKCQSRTVKMCGSCSVPFCCRVCLTSSSLLHQENCLSGVQNSVTEEGLNPDFVEGHPFLVATILSGSTVVMSSYFTMRTVYVRQCDEPWGERFSRLCNEVAEEAIKGHRLEEIPRVHDLVIARYHEDLCFYRAQVCAVAGNRITVFFIDFGNTQETRLEDLKAFPDRLGALPGLAARVRLKDVSEVSSPDAVKYYNELTADSTPLILKSDSWAKEVVLVEKDSNAAVNAAVSRLSLPSWRKDGSSRAEEIFSLDSIGSQKLEVDKCYSLHLSHFDEKEFAESEVFWMVDQGTDEFFHASSEMWPKMAEYCESARGECYLPRANELCLAEENGKWHRCVNLKSHKTACLLFFLDDGHSSLIETTCIRKMLQDFAEIPSQSICCTLPDNPRLKDKHHFHSEVTNYLRAAVGLTIHSVRVLKQMGDAYCLSIPELNDISKRTRNPPDRARIQAPDTQVLAKAHSL